MQEFGVTKHMVKRARQLKKEKGILADLDPKQGRTISWEVVDKVVNFFQADDYLG